MKLGVYEHRGHVWFYGDEYVREVPKRCIPPSWTFSGAEDEYWKLRNEQKQQQGQEFVPQEERRRDAEIDDVQPAAPSVPVEDQRQAMEQQTQHTLRRMCVEPCNAEWQACTKRFHDDPTQIKRCNAAQNACSERCNAMHH
jgi:hypothetical protein